jgi:RNA polymerase sigma-70 factor (ECF subfamily)
MLRYQDGDARAFTVLVERHRRHLYQFVLRSTHEETRAEDITQEAFMRVVRSADSFLRGSRFSTWLFTIARNVCTDFARRGKFREMPSLDAPIDPHRSDSPSKGDFVAGGGAAVDNQAMGTQLKARMHAAIDALPHEQREIFLLREVADLQFNEIAEIVGIAEGTVKSRLRYALEKLREALAEYREQAEEVAR